MTFFRLPMAAALLLAALAGCETMKSDPRGADPAPLQPAAAPPVPAHQAPTIQAMAATTEPATMPAVGAITPEMLEAINELSSTDFKTREAAAQKLQAAMAKHFQQMVLVQQMMLKIQDDLAQQLREMTLAPDADAGSRVAGLMEFNQALSRWAADALALPADQRSAMLKWGLSEEGYPLIVRAYSRKQDVRAGVAKDLAKLYNDQAIWLLGQLLDDPDRQVTLGVMDAVYDKSPSPQMVEILWTKAAGNTIQQYRPRPQRQKVINVHGHMVTLYDQENYNLRMQDGDIAADVLIHWKTPQITDRLNALFKDMMASIRDPNDYRWRALSPNYGDAARTLCRLMEAYRPKEGFNFLLKAMSATVQDGYQNMFNNVNYRQSTTIDTASLLIRMTGQDPDDYKMRKIANFGDRYMLQIAAPQNDQAAALKEEQQMVRKVLLWMKDHYKEFGIDEAPKVPAEIKDEKPAAGAPVPGAPVPVVGPRGRRAAAAIPPAAVAAPADDVIVVERATSRPAASQPAPATREAKTQPKPAPVSSRPAP